MNYIIKLEARGSKGKQEVLEALRRLPYGSMDQKVVVSTVVDGIKVEEKELFLFTPLPKGVKSQERKEAVEGKEQKEAHILRNMYIYLHKSLRYP